MTEPGSGLPRQPASVHCERGVVVALARASRAVWLPRRPRIGRAGRRRRGGSAYRACGSRARHVDRPPAAAAAAISCSRPSTSACTRLAAGAQTPELGHAAVACPGSASSAPDRVSATEQSSPAASASRQRASQPGRDWSLGGDAVHAAGQHVAPAARRQWQRRVPPAAGAAQAAGQPGGDSDGLAARQKASTCAAATPLPGSGW